MRATVVCLLVGYVAFALSSTVPFSDNSSSLVKELETDSLLDIWGGEMVNLVGFYDKENATASTHFATVWEGLATQHAGLFSFSAADGGGKLSFILETLKIKKLPSVLAFPSKLTSSKALPQTYKGPINESSISKWALKQLPHTLVYKIASESNMNTFKGYTTSKKVWFVCRNCASRLWPSQVYRELGGFKMPCAWCLTIRRIPTLATLNARLQGVLNELQT